MNGKLSPLVWIGIGAAGAGLVTGKQSILLFGIGLALAGYVGKERIVGALPPGLQRQITDAIQTAEVTGAPPEIVAPPTIVGVPVLGAQDLILW